MSVYPLRDSGLLERMAGWGQKAEDGPAFPANIKKAKGRHTL